jgi:polyisoprenoid-binding protein YceI
VIARRSSNRIGARRVIAAALIAAAMSARAQAVEWAVVPKASAIAFTFVLNGAPGQGAFRSMSGAGVFSAADPAATRFELRIPTDSLDLGNPLYSAFAQSADWFDTATHPEAVYRLARLTPLPDGRWEALGDITVKGRLVVMRTPIDLEIGAETARARGALVFDRRAVGVGVGPSALFVTLDPDVTVTFDLVARPAAKDGAQE